MRIISRGSIQASKDGKGVNLSVSKKKTPTSTIDYCYPVVQKVTAVKKNTGLLSIYNDAFPIMASQYLPHVDYILHDQPCLLASHHS